MNEKINEIQNMIIKDFSKLNEWFEKYEYLIKLGKNLDSLDDIYKSEEYAISGCQSQVWLKSEIIEGKINFSADSDSLITKGMISLLLRVLNNQYPESVVNADLYFIDEIGLNSNLSPSRANGLMSIVNHIKSSAMIKMNISK
jgi:cysteine desulfuration protein SufE